MFEKMNAEKSYLLGFLATDGCCYNTTVSVELQYKDRDVIYKLSKIFEDNNLSPKIAYPIKKGRKYISLRVNNKKLVEELISIGITPKKTFSIKFFDWIPKEFMRDYLRGIFDGDGSLTIRRNAIDIEIPSASRDFLDGINSFLPFIGISSKNIVTRICKGKNPIHRLFLYSNDSDKFLSFIYYKGAICLDRKYNKFISFVKQPPKNRWSQEDTQFLKENYQRLTAKEISSILNKSIKSVQMKAYHMNLSKQQTA